MLAALWLTCVLAVALPAALWTARCRTRALYRRIDEAEEARARSERALAARTEELERSRGELQEFVHVASHDLREPARIVSSYLNLLTRRYQGKLGSDADEFIGYALQASAHMEELLRDLLEYSRVGTRAGSAAPVSCAAALERALADLGRKLEESGARVTHDPLPEVLADEAQLVRLLDELIDNAIKFARPGDPPAIHVGAAPAADGSWTLSVADGGIGVAPEGSDRIFTIFQRLHARAAYPGTGAGLAIAKRIVERHGGRIWVDREAERGATFRFTLPGATR